MKFRLTRQAERDIADILRGTLKTFGPAQVSAYAAIIERGIAMIAEQPDRPSSLDRSDLRPGVRSFHLEHAAGRRGGAAHKLYFVVRADADAEPSVTVLRVLHERMEPQRRLVQALRGENDEAP